MRVRTLLAARSYALAPPSAIAMVSTTRLLGTVVSVIDWSLSVGVAFDASDGVADDDLGPPVVVLRDERSPFAAG